MRALTPNGYGAQLRATHCYPFPDRRIPCRLTESATPGHSPSAAAPCWAARVLMGRRIETSLLRRPPKSNLLPDIGFSKLHNVVRGQANLTRLGEHKGVRWVDGCVVCDDYVPRAATVQSRIDPRCVEPIDYRRHDPTRCRLPRFGTKEQSSEDGVAIAIRRPSFKDRLAEALFVERAQ